MPALVSLTEARRPEFLGSKQECHELRSCLHWMGLTDLKFANMKHQNKFKNTFYKTAQILSNRESKSGPEGDSSRQTVGNQGKPQACHPARDPCRNGCIANTYSRRGNSHWFNAQVPHRYFSHSFQSSCVHVPDNEYLQFVLAIILAVHVSQPLQQHSIILQIL